jgi:hypothetical protein
VCLYRVADENSPAPFDGDPPAEAAVDCEEVHHEVDLDRETLDSDRTLQFGFVRERGHYYVQTRVILFRGQGAKMFAQTEQFFYSRRPIQVPLAGTITLPATWPAVELDDLHHYGTVRPTTKPRT